MIWLDVDVLENLGDLEKSVKESVHFILFYSEGYFKSINCRREVMKAIELQKPITVILEPNEDISVDKSAQMKEEFETFWPQGSAFEDALTYIFQEDPILWISKGLQFSFESIKLVTGRLLKSLPYYAENSALLDSGLKIDGEITPVEMLQPLDILYCSTNVGAHNVALKVAKECKGDVQTCAMNPSHAHLQRGNREAVMLIYLNKDTFEEPSDICKCITQSITRKVRVILVHENDSYKGGCAFWQIMDQTPKKLMKAPYSIYSEDIAVSLYSIDKYQETSLRQLCMKMGGTPIGQDGATLRYMIMATKKMMQLFN